MNRIKLMAAVLLGITASVVRAADNLPPGVTLIAPGQLKWERSASGRENAYLLGHPNKPGPYLYLVKWAPNMKALAHKHSDDRYGMVVSGIHYIGYGDKFDEKKLHAHTAGTFFTEPANTAHFGMTRGEGAILYFYAIGPSGNTALEKPEAAGK